MLALAAVAAAAALAAGPSAHESCTRLAVPDDARQAVTVEAPTYRTTHAALRIWRRAAGPCWTPAGGPWPARVGRNGLSDDRREGDGTTPAGVFGFDRVMYGNAPNPGVHFRYRRLRCGDWWNEDSSSPGYNSFQHVACGSPPPFDDAKSGMWEQPRPGTTGCML